MEDSKTPRGVDTLACEGVVTSKSAPPWCSASTPHSESLARSGSLSSLLRVPVGEKPGPCGHGKGRLSTWGAKKGEKPSLGGEIEVDKRVFTEKMK